jgi:hypothetical protein
MSESCYFLSFSNLTISIKGILQKLYHYNHCAENWDLNIGRKPVQSGDSGESKSLHNWGGPLMRHALQAIYTIAFICLLRSDEVLKIRRDHIEFVTDNDNSKYMVLNLPFRKTHQDGRMLSSFCRFCPMLIICNGRCSALLYLPT